MMNCTRHSLAGLLAGTGLAAAGLVAPAAAASLDSIASGLQPHKAIYELKVAKIGATSRVAEVGGAIYYDFGETCTAWTVHHKFRLTIVRASRPEVETLTDFRSTESKDGRNFRFRSITRINGQVSERLQGQATLDRIGGPGRVVLTSPEQKQAALPPGTLFPTYHSLRLIQAAQTGVKQFWTPVFDASDRDKYSGVNVVLLGPVGTRIDLAAAPAARALVNAAGWRARVSYFDVGKIDVTPSYELTLRLNVNGVTPAMTLDYGQFTLKAVLRAIEPLPKPKCG
jgi:hypothetical protein